MVTAWQNSDLCYVIYHIGLLFVSGIHKTPSHIMATLNVKKSEIAICKAADRIRLKLMHRDCSALFLRNDKVYYVVHVKHRP